ncbi:hypothetical protein DENIS_1669 [Desulfonema ishimotonii]|uniref:DUF4124 domain-containing protein n=1 Tax=Desulfonema ishimotonii TaxID=45657 RepID=A0A401FUR7_9BACT|nr:retropepsin-like aspartic protease [Desulfonema ishimotonii]GBC60712.1 hypothetical protein DENIS_1669 [Desulfonema ishimotonii]
MKPLCIITFLWVSAFFLISPPLRAEFYRYTDENGRTYFVDDLSKIPGKYRYEEMIKTYREKYDDLSETRRQELMEKNRREADAAAQQHKAFINRLNTEREKREKLLDERKRRRRETPVEIEGNNVIVPVRLICGKKKMTARLLLDTGASVTALHREVARKLSLRNLRKARAQVASGDVIDTWVAHLESVQAGPHIRTGLEAVILDISGDQQLPWNGLLGMNFLRGLRYHVDFERQVISWE